MDTALHSHDAFTTQPLPRTTDAFIGDFYDEGATLEHLLAILENIAADPVHQTFELMCHPAKMDHELREISDYNDKRTEELTVLQDQSIRDFLTAMNIKPIRYSDLQDG